MDWWRCFPAWHVLCCESWILVPNKLLILYAVQSSSSDLWVALPEPDKKKLGTAMPGIINPKWRTGIPSPIPLHCPMKLPLATLGWTATQTFLSTPPPACSAAHTALLTPAQLMACSSHSQYNLGSWQRGSQKGCGAKLSVWASTNYSELLGEETSSSVLTSRLLGRSAMQILLPSVWI